MNDAPDEPEHTPRQPDWTCQTCGQDWPCAPRQTKILGEDSRHHVSSALYLAMQMNEACLDLPQMRAGQLWARFLGWLPGFASSAPTGPGAPDPLPRGWLR